MMLFMEKLSVPIANEQYQHRVGDDVIILNNKQVERGIPNQHKNIMMEK